MSTSDPQDFFESLENNSINDDQLRGFFSEHAHYSCDFCDELKNLIGQGEFFGVFTFEAMQEFFPEIVSAEKISSFASENFSSIKQEEPGVDSSLYRLAFGNPQCPRVVIDSFVQDMEIGGPINYATRSGWIDGHEPIEAFQEYTSDWIRQLKKLEMFKEDDVTLVMKSFHGSNNICSNNDNAIWSDCPVCLEIIKASN